MRILLTIVAALGLLAGTSPAWAATGYTSAGAFNLAVQSYGFKLAVGFDEQLSGSDASSYGMLGIGGEGLASDGTTPERLSVIATDAYSNVTDPNSMGASGSENQFLAGNSDRIVFELDCPVHAFGLYLVGNPSPTGDPAIAFWKMRAFTGSGFMVYSSTTPSKNLSEGNDVYFLGVVSSDEPFERVDLYSDNDPDAVFSFCVDSVTVATAADDATLEEAKRLEEGNVIVHGLAVTRSHTNRFNVETHDRSLGMAVLGAGPVRGTDVTFLGSVESTSDDERVIRLIHLIDAAPAAPPGTLHMGTRAVGGGADLGWQPGCFESYGPNNIGLDITICGEVTAVAPDRSWMTVDDGAGRDSRMGSTGVKVVGDFWGNGVSVGQILRVTGSCSLFKVEGEHYPLVRVASSVDVLRLY